MSPEEQADHIEHFFTEHPEVKQIKGRYRNYDFEPLHESCAVYALAADMGWDSMFDPETKMTTMDFLREKGLTHDETAAIIRANEEGLKWHQIVWRLRNWGHPRWNPKDNDATG